MKLVDLHMHSTASDGSMSPDLLVRHAKRKSLSTIALTDHDTVSGIQEAVDTSIEIGNIRVIPGIELSSEYMGEMHILGYFLDIHDEEFLNELKLLQGVRERRNIKMIEKFAAHDIHIDIKELENIAGGDLVGRPHFASWLVMNNYAKDYYDAFKKFLNDGGVCYVKKEKVTPEKAISIIKNNGGLAVIAHPIFLKAKTRTKLKALFSDLKEVGLDGIEVYHSDHAHDKMLMFESLARELNLLMTGGSDFHGTHKPFIEVGVGRGNLLLKHELVDKMEERLAQNRN